jgi:hypothetical protein
MEKLEFLLGVYKRWGGRGLVLFVAGAVVGAVLTLPPSWYVLYQYAQWEVRQDLASANKREAEADKRASDANTALQELKTKYDDVNAQNQIYQKAEDLRKKNAALQKQAAAKRPKSQILTDLFGEDEYFIIGHNYRRLILDRRYTIFASPGLLGSGYLLGSGGLLGSSANGCTLTVTNVDTNKDDKFEFVEGKGGVLSVGETKVALILMSATSNGSRSEVCVFQQRP